VTDLPVFQELRGLSEADRTKVLDELIRDLGLYLSQAPRFELRDIDMAGDGVGRALVGYPPRGVVVVDARETGDLGASMSVGSPSWLYEIDTRGRGQVVIRAIDGLTAGVRYRVRIMVVR
jgi:hypothetical protein